MRIVVAEQPGAGPERRYGIRPLALHRSAGFRTLGVRERIGRLGGVWRDTVMLERRRQDNPV